MANTLSFEIDEINDGALSLTPCIDGTPITVLVSKFEQSGGYTPTGGYGGLVPSYFNYGPLDRYFCGQEGSQGQSDAGPEIFVLACQCGEAGCWPLKATVIPLHSGYKWAAFNQPHRPQRNYHSFGPFVFEKAQYEQAVRDAEQRAKPER